MAGFSPFLRDPSKVRQVNNSKALSIASPKVIENYNIYLNQAPWLNANVDSLNLAKGIVREVSNSAMVEFDYEITNKSPVYDRLVKDLRLNESKIMESLLVGGRVISKPYIKGSIIGFVAVSPLEYKSIYDSDNDLIFAQFQTKYNQSGFFYTLNEEHTYDKASKMYTIKYYLYKSAYVTELGKPAELSEVIELRNVTPVLELAGVERHLCTEVILGDAIFADAKQLIKNADEQYSRMLWEFKAGEMAIDVSADLLKKPGSSNLNVSYDLPTGKERLYRKMPGATSAFGMEHWSPTLRDESYIRGLDKILRRIEFACGLSYGTLSESSEVQKTATEIIASKQRYYTTISSVQFLLKNFINGTVDAVKSIAVLISPSFLTLDVSVEYSVGDSILTDRKEQIEEKVMLFEKGLLSIDDFKLWYSKM